MTWDKSLEPVLRQASLKAMIASTEAMATRCPQLGAMYLSIGDGHAFFQGPRAAMSMATGIGSSGSVSTCAIEEVEDFYRGRV